MIKLYAILLTPFTKRNIFILQYVLIFDNECKKICVWRKKLDNDFLLWVYTVRTFIIILSFTVVVAALCGR